jgi:hypothetical protein
MRCDIRVCLYNKNMIQTSRYNIHQPRTLGEPIYIFLSFRILARPSAYVCLPMTSGQHMFFVRHLVFPYLYPNAMLDSASGNPMFRSAHELHESAADAALSLRPNIPRCRLPILSQVLRRPSSGNSRSCCRRCGRPHYRCTQQRA